MTAPFRRARGASVQVALAALIGFVAACAPGDPLPRPGHDYRIDVVARGLEVPWSLALANDGRVFITERPGRIRLVVDDTLASSPWANVAVFDGTSFNRETGLMGLALHPDFPATPVVFVCYTFRLDDGMLVNRVAQLRERNGRGEELTVLLDRIPAGDYHNGCRVKIGPDKKLYVTTGDAYRKTPAQNPSSLAGKVLRLNLDGSIPADNPSGGSPVWTMGHRNPQGIAWDLQTGIAYVTEHGDSITDEINVLQRGANYGWPNAQGKAGNAEYQDAALVFHVAPTGAAFLADSASIRAHEMLIASLSGRLIRMVVDGNAVRVVDDSVLVGYGRLRDVAAAPDGSVYVSTSNRDGRGTKRKGDDRVLRVWLRPN